MQCQTGGQCQKGKAVPVGGQCEETQVYHDHVQGGYGHHGKGTQCKEVQVVVGSFSQTGDAEDSIADDVCDADDGHQDGAPEEDVETFRHGVQSWLMIPILVGLFGNS